MENVIFDEQCREALIKGALTAAKAVQVTFGPNGSNVAIHSNSGIKITKDGATVARAVNSNNSYENIGIEMLKKISEKTASDIGDGSTTAAVLAKAIIEEFKTYENPVAMARTLKKDCQSVVEWLEAQKKDITGKEDLKKVATISANNDPELGELIATVFDTVGKDGIVDFVESDEVHDRVEYSEGYRLSNGYSSPYFVNNTKGTCELSDVLIYISDVKMDDVKFVAAISSFAMKFKKSLLLIAPGFDSEIYIGLKNNKEILSSCCVISPNFRQTRDTIMEDLKIRLGSPKAGSYTIAQTPYHFTVYACAKAKITSSHTELSGFDDNKEAVEARISEIKEILENRLSEYEQEFHQSRLANFTSGMAKIYVGGYSPLEVKERLDRVEDAVRATRAAYSGVLPGGGTALYKASESGIAGSLGSVLKTPYNILKTKDTHPEEDFWCGYDWKTGEYGDLMTMGVIEPFLVEKTALENAVNAASLILTCNCAILNFMNYGE